MKERGILFQGDMVRALLSDSKTQTRRALRPQPPAGIESFCTYHHPKGIAHYGFDEDKKELMEWSAVCPYGVPGDRLWVRETWMADPEITDDWPSTQFHGCKPRDHSLIPERYRSPRWCLYRADGAELHGWTPAIHMFRWASRITLEITDVRVERLQAISEADAIAEGITGPHDVGYPAYRMPGDSKPRYSRAAAAYESLWESINGAGSWDANPWVWAVSFRRLP